MNNAADNPLLADQPLPPFHAIRAEHVVPAVETMLAENRAGLKRQLAELGEPTWDTLVEPLEEREDRLSRLWSPVSHLNSVANNAELRDAYQQALTALTEYNTELAQNRDLYDAYQRLADSDEYHKLTRAQRKAVDNTLRDFRLAGVALDDNGQREYGRIKQRLTELSTQFANNVMDATQAWYKHITDEALLAGIPESARLTARAAAEQRELPGYVFTLDAPAFLAVMTHADNQSLREEMYRAFVTRASHLGVAVNEDDDPTAWDNTPLIDEILALRYQLARLLGYTNYAELSLATKMADTPADVIGFLNQLAQTTHPVAKKEFTELEDYARATFGVERLNAWDVAYYSEKRRQKIFAISEEELRPYFPAPKVIDGLFQVAQRLYDVHIEADPDVETWHPDAQYYRIEQNGDAIAGFYLDLYARENKRGGAWMDECRVRRRTSSGLQLPVAYLTCNFSPPGDDRPSLLTHSEVTTLFHEFGHGLHHMLTRIDCAPVSGINGVAWDAVELPSQMLENWCWQEEVIPLISAHFETGEPLPQEMLQKLLSARNFQSAMQMVRQLEFALFDFRLHLEYDAANPRPPQALLDEVRRQVSVIVPPDYNKFQNSFSHIFAGGYAAGYYSYKWAEVLAADAFALFEEQGVFHRETARRFHDEILSQGGADDAKNLFVNFRGREPEIEPLLRHSGIVVSAERL